MLALGAKIPRKKPLKNQAQPKIFRENDPSICLLIWCSWRLELPDGLLASSDGGKTSENTLQLMEGKAVRRVEHIEPAHDLIITFDDSSKLRVFADHVDDDECSFVENWELTTPSFEVSAGPGARIDIERRGQTSLGSLPGKAVNSVC